MSSDSDLHEELRPPEMYYVHENRVEGPNIHGLAVWMKQVVEVLADMDERIRWLEDNAFDFTGHYR